MAVGQQSPLGAGSDDTGDSRISHNVYGIGYHSWVPVSGYINEAEIGGCLLIGTVLESLRVHVKLVFCVSTYSSATILLHSKWCVTIIT